MARYRGYKIEGDAMGFAWRHMEYCGRNPRDKRIGHSLTAAEARDAIDADIERHGDGLGPARAIIWCAIVGLLACVGIVFACGRLWG